MGKWLENMGNSKEIDWRNMGDNLGQHLENMGNSWETPGLLGWRNFLGTSLQECVAEISIGMMNGMMEINLFIIPIMTLICWKNTTHVFGFHFSWPKKLVVMDGVLALHWPFWGRSRLTRKVLTVGRKKWALWAAGKVAEPINFERTLILDFVTFQCYIQLDWWFGFFFPHILGIVSHHH